MSPKRVWTVVLLGALALAGCRDDRGLDPETGTGERAGDPAAVPVPVNLYFPGVGGRLYAERREIALEGSVAERIETLVGALLAGPHSDSMRPPLPEGVSLRKVYLLDGEQAFLDLESTAEAPLPASGSQREILTVYSLVNTVLLNVDEVDELVLLWNGRQRETFAGHLDTTQPLVPDLGLIASAQ